MYWQLSFFLTCMIVLLYWNKTILRNFQRRICQPELTQKFSYDHNLNQTNPHNFPIPYFNPRHHPHPHPHPHSSQTLTIKKPSPNPILLSPHTPTKTTHIPKSFSTKLSTINPQPNSMPPHPYQCLSPIQMDWIFVGSQRMC